MNTMSKGRRSLFLIALLSTTVAMMAETPITPAADTLYKEFANEAAVNLFLSIPTLTAMFASIILGSLMMKVNKKYILLLGAVSFTAGGLCGGLIHNLTYMTVMRSILGIGLGASNVAAIAIISDVFIDETIRSKYVSYISAGISLSGVILTFIGGQIAESFGWKAVFNIYWFGLVMIALVILFIPSCPPIKAGDTDADQTDKRIPIEANKTAWKANLAALIASELVWFIFYGLVFFQVSVYIAERSIGNEAFSGMTSSLGNLSAFAACMIFGMLYEKMKRSIAIINYAALTVGFALFLFGHSQATTIIAAILMGYGYGNSMSYFAVRASVIVPKEQSAIAITSFSAVMGIGLFLSTYAAMLIKTIMKVDTFVGMLPAVVAVAVLGTILSIVLTIRDKKHPSQYYMGMEDTSL